MTPPATPTDQHDTAAELLADPSAHGWAAGYAAALADIAARHAELAEAWRPIGQRLHAQRVATRLALYERCAAQLAERMGRPPGYTYTGGPVPWEGHHTAAHTTPACRGPEVNFRGILCAPGADPAGPDASRLATPDASRPTMAPPDASTAEAGRPATGGRR